MLSSASEPQARSWRSVWSPIETEQGWLLIYHGVLISCNGFVYSMGAALLDLDEPWKVIARSRDYLLSPQVPYEQVGDVPNVVFPCGAVVIDEQLFVYYGGADKFVGVATIDIDLLVEGLVKEATAGN